MAEAAGTFFGVIMRRILVTGGAGFIGSNFVQMVLSEHPDWLTNIVSGDDQTFYESMVATR